MNCAKKHKEIKLQTCGFRRRIGAIFYDSLLLASVLIFATVLVLPFTGGEAVESTNFLYKAYLILICWAYFVLPWVVRGQTLGMQTWKIKVLTTLVDGEAKNRAELSLEDQKFKKISWLQASQRFFLAIFSWSCVGLGFFWALFSKERLCWHDRLSHSQLVYFKPVKNKPNEPNAE